MTFFFKRGRLWFTRFENGERSDDGHLYPGRYLVRPFSGRFYYTPAFRGRSIVPLSDDYEEAIRLAQYMADYIAEIEDEPPRIPICSGEAKNGEIQPCAKATPVAMVY